MVFNEQTRVCTLQLGGGCGSDGHALCYADLLERGGATVHAPALLALTVRLHAQKAWMVPRLVVAGVLLQQRNLWKAA